MVNGTPPEQPLPSPGPPGGPYIIHRPPHRLSTLFLIGIWVVSTALLVLLAGLAGWLGGRFWPGSGKGSAGVWKDSPPVIRQIEGLNELVTVKYVMEKALYNEDLKWYGDNRLLMIAHGIVKAGVDLSQIRESDILVDGRTIRMRLPRARITDAYLDDRRTQIIERSTAMLRIFDKDLEQQGRRQAVDTLRLSARDAGILQDAEERARLQLRQLFLTLGFESVEFVEPGASLQPTRTPVR